MCRAQILLFLLSPLALGLGFADTARAVDGVVEINQAAAVAGGVTSGDAPGFPVTISATGSYRLTGDLIVSDAAAPAVEITADYVTLDLNGFKVEGVPASLGGTAAGILATAGYVGVRNGYVREFGSHGVHITSSSATIQGVQAIHNGGTGLKCDQTECVIEDCLARDGGGDGIECAQRCHVRRSRALQNAGSGIVAGARSVVIEGYAAQNAFSVGQVGDGIRVDSQARVERSYVEQHQHGHGISAAQATIADNVVFSSSDNGINCPGICVIHGNTVQGATIGILAYDGSVVYGNSIRSSSSFGLELTGGGFWGNAFFSNNGGDANPQTSGGVDLGSNLCRGTEGCP